MDLFRPRMIRALWGVQDSCEFKRRVWFYRRTAILCRRKVQAPVGERSTLFDSRHRCIVQRPVSTRFGCTCARAVFGMAVAFLKAAMLDSTVRRLCGGARG